MSKRSAQNPLREKLFQGLKYQQSGDISKAQDCYKKVLQKLPNNADALHLLGVSYRQLGQPELAIDLIQKAIKSDPRQSVFYANLARAMMDLGTDPESLLLVCSKALELNPKEREARNIVAVALTRQKKYEDAEYILQELIVEDPNYKDAYQNYGMLLIDADKAEHAITFFTKAIMLDPDNVNNYVQRARCRLKLKQLEPSQYELTEALERFPDNSDVQHEAARLLFTMNENFKGIGYARKAVASDPTNFHKNVTLGVSLLMHGEFDEALNYLQLAKQYAPENQKSVDWNLSLAYLANGDLENGWALHSARFEDPSSQVLRRTFEVPAWQGEDISDKTILVWADQGLGDALKSGTMLPQLIEKAGKVIVEVSVKAAALMQQSFPEATCRKAQMDTDLVATASDYDVTVNITDMAKYLRPRLEDFDNAPSPVYKIEQERARRYLERLKDYDNKPIIGFSWRSKNLAPHRARYYLSAPGFSPILESTDAIYVNLQYQAIEKELEFFRNRFSDKFNYFEDVDLFNDLLGAAALTGICDFVVSANTSVADMAGILGVPSIRFGQQEPPLLLGQNNPPWYPTMIYMHPYTDRPCAEFVPEIIKELGRQLANWTPEARNARLGL